MLVNKQKEFLEIGIALQTKPLLEAWLRAALGSVVILKQVGGKSIVVEDKDEVARAVNALKEDGGKTVDGQYYFITTKEADTNAIKEIFTRLHGRAKEDGEGDKNNAINFANALFELARKGLEIRAREIETRKTDFQLTDGGVQNISQTSGV